MIKGEIIEIIKFKFDSPEKFTVISEIISIRIPRKKIKNFKFLNFFSSWLLMIKKITIEESKNK